MKSRLLSNKHGEMDKVKSAREAVLVIGIITVIIIFYILFLPPADRSELLDQDFTPGSGTTPSTQQPAKILLDQNVGSLEYYSATPDPHTLSGVSLFAESESQVLTTINPFRVRNGWFEKQGQKVNFAVTDLEHTDQILLTLEATIRQGPLTISLNEQPIYNFVPETGNIGPIDLPKNILRETNVLDFNVASVGWKFWTTNEYAFQQGQIIGEVVDVNKQQSDRSFSLTESEKNNLETVVLTFFPRCNQQEVGNLEIILNGRRIYNAVPTCRSINLQDLFPTELLNGKNDLSFRTRKGEYDIEQIRIETKLKEAKSYVQYFQVDPEADKLLRNAKRPAYLEITFVDDGKEKRGEISVNGRLTFLDQKGATYAQRIDGFLNQGNNYIELRPESSMQISQLRVVIR